MVYPNGAMVLCLLFCVFLLMGGEAQLFASSTPVFYMTLADLLVKDPPHFCMKHQHVFSEDPIFTG